METPPTSAYHMPIQPIPSVLANAPSRPKGTKRRRPGKDEGDLPAKKTLFVTEPVELCEPLGRDWYFSTSHYLEQLYYHFRKFERKGDKLVPTKKGISLRPNQLTQLIQCAETLDNSAEVAFAEDIKTKEYSVHIGYGVYITVKKDYGKWFDIRKFFKPDGCYNPVHTRKGAMLNNDEFTIFIGLIPKIYEHKPDLRDIPVCDCMFQGNQLAYLKCPECNPFDFQNW